MVRVIAQRQPLAKPKLQSDSEISLTTPNNQGLWRLTASSTVPKTSISRHTHFSTVSGGRHGTVFSAAKKLQNTRGHSEQIWTAALAFSTTMRPPTSGSSASLLSPQEERRECLLLCKLPLPKKITFRSPTLTLPSPSPLRPDLPAGWLAGAERGVLLSAHEHARRNRSRRGPVAPTGTGDPARTSHPTRCAPASNGEGGATRTLAAKARPAAEPAGLPARRGCHSRRSSTTSAVSVADELLGFFSARKALHAGVGFRGSSARWR